MRDAHQPANEIRVDAFRQILIWPLLIHDTNGKHAVNLTSAVASKLTGNHWQWADQSPDHKAISLRDFPSYEANRDDDYSEIVYFHSFVRDFLYGGDGAAADKRPMRMLRRSDVRALKLKLDDTREYEFHVSRIEGYLFELGVLLVVVEVEGPTNLAKTRKFTLKDALDLQNVLRMVFPRRWNDDGKPSEAPLRACWLDANGHEIEGSMQDFLVKGDFTKIVREQAELPAAKHWRYLLRPLPLYGEPKVGDFAVKQIEDQRIPSMTYLAVPDPRQISEGDFARIAFFDDAGESSVGPYSDKFLADWMKESAYDRFWQRTPSSGGTEVDEHNRMMRTRWLCSGYGFAVVGPSNDSFFTGRIAANFRHHYFRMGLIAHVHRAMLLMFRDHLAEATKKTGEEFRDRIMKIQQDVTRFRARFWFREVSTQLQGQEIFAWWSDRLGNQALFDQVTADIAAAETQVRTEFEEEEAKGIKLLTEIGGVIGIVSVLLSVMALVVSLTSASWDLVARRIQSGFIVYDIIMIISITILLSIFSYLFLRFFLRLWRRK